MNKLMVVAMALCLTAKAFAATTVVDTVTVSYTKSGSESQSLGIALLALYGGGISMGLGGGTWGVPGDVAGGQPMLSRAQTSNEASGGYLHYTLYGMGTAKITVEQDISTPTGYIANSLKVKILPVGAGGVITAGTWSSEQSTLGVPVDGYYQNISSTPATLINGISGEKTWTGSAAGQGAQLGYQLVADPGTTIVTVLYTLLAVTGQ